MNDQTNMAQLRYLEELKISLVHAGFEPERIEDQHLPVRWENHYLCRVSGRGSVLYRQENVDGIGAQDALQTVIHIAAMTAEYMTAMERAPVLQATGLEGDYFQNGYEEAKHDFVRRSGLLPREALFEPEQLAEMHRALAFVCEQDEGLSIGREKEIKTIMEQIKCLLPESPEQTQTMEQSM